MSQSQVVIRARKFFVNHCLNRKQFVIDVSHKGVKTVSKEQLRELLSKKYKCDPKNIVLFGFQNAFGGGKSTGFGLIYENQDYLKKYEPKPRLRRLKLLAAKQTTTRKTRKEIKIKRKKVRGKAKLGVQAGKKKFATIAGLRKEFQTKLDRKEGKI